jgi:hypothetical protein
VDRRLIFHEPETDSVRFSDRPFRHTGHGTTKSADGLLLMLEK